MLTITKSMDFEAAHKLPNHLGKCKRVHGHSYHVEVTVSGAVNEDKESPCYGMIMDFHDLNNCMKEVKEKYDHRWLNYLVEVPTAECLCIEIADHLKGILPSGITLEEVKLWETRDSYATWRK